MIIIIDYGMGNLWSVANMIKKVWWDAEISSDIEKIKSAKKLILPWVWAFDQGIKNLKELWFFDVIKEKVLQQKTPILWICLWAQLMTESSEEWMLPGLALIQGKTIKFDIKDKKYKVPHMGWNDVFQKKESKLFKNMYEEPRFYFVHSYHFLCKNSEDILTESDYWYRFVSAFENDNIYWTQFHPEKSHKFGMKIIENFINNI